MRYLICGQRLERRRCGGSDAWADTLTPTPRQHAAVTILRVHPLVWRRALHLADGDARRIEVLHEQAVVVRNRAARS